MRNALGIHPVAAAAAARIITLSLRKHSGQYFSPEGLQLREDLRVDDVELCLDLVAAHVVHGGDMLVEDQVFGGGWKPEKKQLVLMWSRSSVD